MLKNSYYALQTFCFPAGDASPFMTKFLHANIRSLKKLLDHAFSYFGENNNAPWSERSGKLKEEEHVLLFPSKVTVGESKPIDWQRFQNAVASTVFVLFHCKLHFIPLIFWIPLGVLSELHRYLWLCRKTTLLGWRLNAFEIFQMWLVPRLVITLPFGRFGMKKTLWHFGAKFCHLQRCRQFNLIYSPKVSRIAVAQEK